VTHCDISAQGREVRFQDDFADQSHTSVAVRASIGIHRDNSGTLLSPMLERIETQVRDSGRVVNGRDSDDAAHQTAGR
jgi:hypothetical protein